jgi:hypothetical protein
MSQPEPSEIANRLPLAAITPGEISAATAVINRNATSDDDRDQLLWMLGIHDKPEAPGPIHRQSLTSRRSNRRYQS